jgi:membrane-bound ClpP family serine protease
MAAPPKRPDPLKPAGFLLLIVGWILVLSAVQMLKAGAAQGAFVAAGIAVEILGFVLVVRSHLAPKPERNQ